MTSLGSEDTPPDIPEGDSGALQNILEHHCSGSEDTSPDDPLVESEDLWKATAADVGALQNILEQHFHRTCIKKTQMNEGCYARVFRFDLDNGLSVIGRIILPVRSKVKTESEIAAMKFVKARTKIPVPEVYMYCSTSENPVRAEWILMEYLSGTTFDECFYNLPYSIRRRTASDFAEIICSLYRITSHVCGAIMPTVSSAYLRYPLFAEEMFRYPGIYDKRSGCTVGPWGEIVLLKYSAQAPAEICEPCLSERQYMETIAYRGIPGIRSTEPIEPEPFDGLLRLYDYVRSKFSKLSTDSVTASPIFHFSHGDLNESNILLDPETGAITGVIDWELAGFRPAWKAVANTLWFDEDYRRFWMENDTDPAEEEKDTPEDIALRACFHRHLWQGDEDVFFEYWHSVEFRAFYINLCREYPGSPSVWIDKYEEKEWNTQRRGPFPSTVKERVDEEQPSINLYYHVRDEDQGRKERREAIISRLQHFNHKQTRYPSLFGLLVGINTYVHLPNLYAAVADAKRFSKFLIQKLGVNEDQISLLLNQQATRQGILSQIEAFQNDDRIQYGDPILIYFAGYGDHITMPTSQDGNANGKVEAIIPHDFGNQRNADRVGPISAPTFHTLLERLSERKGSNIVTIFDCCYAHSGSQLRGGTIRMVRGMQPGGQCRLYDREEMNISGEPNDLCSFAVASSTSHVHFAACLLSEAAIEADGKAEFTDCLLQALRRPGFEQLTYDELADVLELIPGQTPECKGSNHKRIVFQMDR